MKEKTRGRIESLLDNALKKEYLLRLSNVEWVRRETPIHSFEDFAFGYIVGVLKTITELKATSSLLDVIVTNKPSKHSKEIDDLLKRRLKEILERVNRELGT
jgi:hypothetical protein